ncbi:MAG: hypothetical protein A2Y25_05085 [Candidatus Melainabacteria bacterium GWF2_37_15]|nr:MAG: hypothetical protein A2Y25_05085 [Candidatus Melainabacteria bacterium GWF2_37_15]
MCKKNTMGSEVVEGFACKPQNLDVNKPLMYSAAQIFICEGHRCGETQDTDLTDKVRVLIKNLGYDKGNNRIKVTRTHCQGACRFRNFMCAYRNGSAVNFSPENSFSAWKKVNQWNEEQWQELIKYLAEGIEPQNIIEFKVEEKIYCDCE